MRIMGAGGEQTGRFYNEEWSILCCSSGGVSVHTTLQAGDNILDNHLYHKAASLK